MKIGCFCGEQIVDQTDFLPSKAHFIPDIDWFSVMDEMEEVIEKVAAGQVTKEQALNLIHDPLLTFSRQIWQCRHCGRIYIDPSDGSRRLECYKPQTESGDRRVLQHPSLQCSARGMRKRKTAEPGATDNPDDAERLREDH